MQLSTGISFVALVVSIVTLVLVFQLFTWERSEPPKDNSLACAELLTARATVNWPGTDAAYYLSTARETNEQTIGEIDRDRIRLECKPPGSLPPPYGTGR